MTEPMHRKPRKRRETLTDEMVTKLERKAKRYVISDPEQRGLYVRIMPKGPNVYAAVARDPYGKQVWATVGSADMLNIEEARDKARTAIRRIKEGKPAFEPPPAKAASYKATAEKFLEVYATEAGLRSQPEIERLLKRHVYPFWAKRDFVSIGREEINEYAESLVQKAAVLGPPTTCFRSSERSRTGTPRAAAPTDRHSSSACAAPKKKSANGISHPHKDCTGRGR